MNRSHASRIMQRMDVNDLQEERRSVENWLIRDAYAYAYAIALLGYMRGADGHVVGPLTSDERDERTAHAEKQLLETARKLAPALMTDAMMASTASLDRLIANEPLPLEQRRRPPA